MLWKGAKFLSLFNDRRESFEGYDEELLGIIRPFSGLEELLLAEWRPGDLTTTMSKDEVGSETRLEPEGQKQHGYGTDKLWSCIDIAEADGLMHLFSPYPHCKHKITAAGPKSLFLTEHKQQCGDEASYFRDSQEAIRGLLTKEMARLISEDTEEKIDTVISCVIPRLRAVHVLSPLEHKILSQERLNVAQAICNLQKEWASVVRPISESSLSFEELAKAELAFGKTHFPHNEPWDAEEIRTGAPIAIIQRTWWIRDGPVPEVGDLLL